LPGVFVEPPPVGGLVELEVQRRDVIGVLGAQPFGGVWVQAMPFATIRPTPASRLVAGARV
jgi:hypothetical protein